MDKGQSVRKSSALKRQSFLIVIFVTLPLLYLTLWNGVLKKEERIKAEKSVLLNQQYQPEINTELKSIEEKASLYPSEDNYIELSVAYYNNGLYNECISACYKAIEINPKSAVAYNNIGTAYNKLGQYADAKKNCEKSLEIDSGFTLAKNNLKLAIDRLK